MCRIPSDVLITPSRSSPGSTNASPSSLMFDRANVVWNEMSTWPSYDRETDNTEVLCPVGMRIITDNIISSCGLPYFFFFPTLCLQALRSAGISLCCSSVSFSIYCPVALLQILCIFHMIHYTCLDLQSLSQYAKSHSFFPSS